MRGRIVQVYPNVGVLGEYTRPCKIIYLTVLEYLVPQNCSASLKKPRFLLLYQDRVAAICNLNEDLVYEEMIPLVRLNQSGTF